MILEARCQVLRVHAHGLVVPAFSGMPQVLHLAPQPSLLSLELLNDLLGYEHGYRTGDAGCETQRTIPRTLSQAQAMPPPGEHRAANEALRFAGRPPRGGDPTAGLVDSLCRLCARRDAAF